MANPALSSPSNIPQLTSYQAVLFDLDGVITPTADVHRDAWREVFVDVLPKVADEQNRTYTEDDYYRHIDGRPRYAGVERLLAAHGVALPWGSPDDEPGIGTVCAIGNLKNVRFKRILQRRPIAAYPGSLALMERLKAKGTSMAIVSSSANAIAVLDAAGLRSEFDVVVDGIVIAELGLAGKPQPDPFLEAALRVGSKPADSVVVEDAIAGVEAGRVGGFGLVVGVARDVDPSLLHEAGADVVVGDLSELL